jgi:hypothetical protein
MAVSPFTGEILQVKAILKNGLALVSDVKTDEAIPTPTGGTTRTLSDFNRMNLKDVNGITAPNPGAYRSACDIVGMYARVTGEALPPDIVALFTSAPEDPDDPAIVAAHKAAVKPPFIVACKAVRADLRALVGMPVSGTWTYADSTAHPGTQVLSVDSLSWGLTEAAFDDALDAL